MSVNLLAVCKQDGSLAVRRIKTTAAVQSQLEGIFIQQEQAFLAGITEEVLFDGGWTPEANELLYGPITPEAAAVLAGAEANLVAIQEISIAAFAGQGIRALGVLVQRPGGPRLLLQNFSSAQLLERNFSLVLDGDTFNHLNKTAFSIGSQLAGIIEDNKIKFRSYVNIKRIFDLTDLYKEATDAEIDAFCSIERLHVTDSDAFKKVADQGMRKLVHAITASNTLIDFSAQQISDVASGQGFAVSIVNDKLIVPNKKSDAKAFLHFLDHGLYRAAITGHLHIANSKRRFVPAGN